MSSVEKSSNLGLPGVQKIREFLGLTQEELAKEVKITTRWLSSVENGFKDCKMGVARTFARVLHCQLQDMLSEPTASRLEEIRDEYEAVKYREAQARVTARALAKGVA